MSPRWQSIQNPHLNRICFVSGNLISNYKWEGVLLLCITLTNLSYLPSDSQASIPLIPAVTPSGRKRGRNVFGASVTAPKVKPRAAVPSSCQASFDVPIDL